MQDNKLFLSAIDVSKCMQISIPMAYKIIRKLNDELQEKGYLVICGKINRKFFESKIYGGLDNREQVSYARL